MRYPILFLLLALPLVAQTPTGGPLYVNSSGLIYNPVTAATFKSANGIGTSTLSLSGTNAWSGPNSFSQTITGTTTGNLTTSSTIIPSQLAGTGTTTANLTLSGSNNFTGPLQLNGNAVNTAGGLTTLDSNGLFPFNIWTANLNGQSFMFEGDSITAGVGLSSPSTQNFGYLFSRLSWALNHGTYRNDAVNGSFVLAGSNGGQTVTTSGTVSSGTAITLTTSPSAPTGPMAVDPAHLITNIPKGTSGTLSGTTLTLSNAITGTITSGTSVVLGGNNVTDRYYSQVYPHRPTANGGDGGARSIVWLMIGTNDWQVGGESASTIITAITSYITQAHADGFFVVVSTITPRSTPTYADSIREAADSSIRSNAIGADLITDIAALLPDYTNTTFYQGDNIHPTLVGAQTIANYYNALMTSNGAQYRPQEGTFENPIIGKNGISTSTITLTGASQTVSVNAPLQWAAFGQINLETVTGQAANITTYDPTGTFQNAFGYGDSTYGITYLRNLNFIYLASHNLVIANGSAVLDVFNEANGNFSSAGTGSFNGITDTGTVSITSGNVAFQSIGNTVSLKGGSNATSGTVALVAGTGTVSSTAITASSVIFASLKTAGGTETFPPLITVSTGTAIFSANTLDTGVYNWGMVIVNQ